MAINLQVATIQSQNFSSVSASPYQTTTALYEKNYECIFEDESKIYNNQKIINCSNEKSRYSGTRLICDNHLREYFKLVIMESDLREVKDMQNSKYIRLVYAKAYKNTIPFPFTLNVTMVDDVETYTLCLKRDPITLYDDRPQSFFASILAFASNGVIHSSGFANLNNLISDATLQQPFNNKYSTHYQTVSERWKNTWILMRHTNQRNEISHTYINGLQLPYIYQTVLFYTEMGINYIVPKNRFAEGLNALDNTIFTRVLQPNMIIDLDVNYIKMVNFEAPQKVYILEDGTNYASPIILAGFQIFEDGAYIPHNYQHSSIEMRKFNTFCT